MSKADEVIKRIDEQNKCYSLEILGTRKEKADGFYILMNTQQLVSDEKDTFHLIKKSTLDLLDEAEIKYKIL